jgi:hypothetical protein
MIWFLLGVALGAACALVRRTIGGGGSPTTECPKCGGTGSVGACDPDDLEPDQSPLEAWGYGCDLCNDTGRVTEGERRLLEQWRHDTGEAR